MDTVTVSSGVLQKDLKVALTSDFFPQQGRGGCIAEGQGCVCAGVGGVGG